MNISLRTATLDDAGFLADVVIRATLAQGRFPNDIDLAEYRAGYEEWTRETVLGNIPNCTLSVIEQDGLPIGRLRVVREVGAIELAGIQLLPDFQNQRIGSALVAQLKQEADQKRIPLQLSVEKDNPHALRFYQRLGFVFIGESEDAYQLEYHSIDRSENATSTNTLVEGEMSNTPNVTQAVPFLSVSDMQASLRFYVDGLGFRMTRHWTVDGNVRWCWLEIGQAALMLQSFQADRPPSWPAGAVLGTGVTINFMCQDALSIYRDVKQRGIAVEQPFVGNGMWVVAMRDPDGYRIEFESVTDVAEGARFFD